MKPDAESQKAVILLSGGLDSATVLAIARDQGYQCYALSLDYGQRHHAELAAAQRIAATLGAVEHKTIPLDLTWIGGSALTDPLIDVPRQPAEGIPVTYVPARNTIFLSIALGWAEVLSAWDLFIGVNAVDYSGYPDCRPEYIQAFQRLCQLATRAGAEGGSFRVRAPLIDMGKADIIRTGIQLGVDYGQTLSCYAADEAERTCEMCDSCRLRSRGFAQTKVKDPTRYRK